MTTQAPPSGEPSAAAAGGRSLSLVLLLAIGVAAVCGLVYELLAGALSAYLLGSSVTQFSLVIGVFLCAMGVGSWVSQHIRGNLVAAFVAVEIAVGVIGGFTGLAGFVAFAYTEVYRAVLFGIIVVVGILIGLEVPLVVRILRRRQELRVSVANVMAADYAGALFASVVFPFVLVPHAGLVNAGLLTGLANVGVAWIAIWVLRRHLAPWRGMLIGLAAVATVLLGGATAASGTITDKLQGALFQDEVFLSRSTPYQHVTLTRWRDDVRLYIDGALQFSSSDEYRYHEALVHPAMSSVPYARRVLILGGGDGMAAREVLKYQQVERVDLVDLDPVITELFRDRPELSVLNGGSLSDPRVHVHNQDAARFLDGDGPPWDVVIVDLPDPNNLSLSGLYTRQFYRLVLKRLGQGGAIVTQATSPFHTREAFWCIAHTMGAVERRGPGPAAGKTLNVHPYHAYVPSFGPWGFVLASPAKLDPARAEIRVDTKWLTPQTLDSMFSFGKDVEEVDTPINRVDDHALVRLYAKGYQRHFE